ncbi:MAG: DUF4249 domain-containing protein [Bacteroidota bacterium]
MRRLIAIVFILTSCVEPYNPAGLDGNIYPMVVDGYIDLDGSASVKLSTGVPLSASDTPPTVTGAAVTIESSGGETFQLHEDEPGTYTAGNLNVDKISTYAVHVVTENNDYRSDDVHIYSTPPIDSVYWSVNGANRLEIMLDSHDDNPDGPGLYLANGIETYEYHAELQSNFNFIDRKAIPRTPNEEVYVCWRDEIGASVLTNTNNLKKTVISGMVISTIEATSHKLLIRYSILARLRSVSPEEFDFQRELIANEKTGSLFSPIPATTISNVHSTRNPGETVLGWFRGQQIRELRYFIGEDTHTLPGDFKTPPPSTCVPLQTCPFGLVSVSPCTRLSELNSATIITDVVMRGDDIVSYIFTSPECGDCRVQGGTTTRPPYW